jgi:hypothetical protein
VLCLLAQASESLEINCAGMPCHTHVHLDEDGGTARHSYTRRVTVGKHPFH